jgi:serine/threonine protein kinase
MTAQAQQIAPPRKARKQPANESHRRRKKKMLTSLEGQSLGKYRIMEPLGRGGMAQVYRAYHPQLDRYVAIKVLRSDLVEEAEFLARFRREAQSVAHLRHENVVQVHDFDVEGAVYYMVMELLEGDTLKVRLNEYRARGERMPTGEMLRITLDALHGLAYANSEGIVHRDIKPANILLTKRGQAVLTDFGIAQIVGGTNYTVSGALMGTLAYMAPEQGLEGTTGIHSDIYSLGIVFYEMLTGRPPFDADTPLAILMKHVNDPLPLPRTINQDIPESFERVVLKALAKKPDDRFQTADEMIQALEAAATEVEADLPDRVPDPDFTVVGKQTGVAVLSGDDRQSITDIPIVSDETEVNAGQTLVKKQTAAQQTTTRVEKAATTSSISLRAPKGFWGNAWQTIMLMLITIAGYNLTAVMLGLVSKNWRIYEVGWPAEVILVGLLFAMVMVKTQAPWMMFPTGIILGNGLLLGFYAVTGWWDGWNFLWPLEPLLVLGTVGYALWLGTQGDQKHELVEKFGQKLVRIAVLGLIIVIAIAALPFG